MTMLTGALIIAAVLLVSVALLYVAVTHWGCDWGARPAECARDLPGDDFLADGPPTRTVMTRAISIAAPPETVWPWLAQLGRGAGWYSYDLLDNGRRVSARHIVSWIPEPALGDASPIGYLRHIEPGRSLVWWIRGVSFAGAVARLAVAIVVEAEGGGSRLIIRNSADAVGSAARPALAVFRFVDSIMAQRQLLGIRRRAQEHGTRNSDPDQPETGARDQYQLYETVYASGEAAGVRGKEGAAQSRELAIEDGVIAPPDR